MLPVPPKPVGPALRDTKRPKARRLHHLFDKNLERALQIVDKGDVKCYAAERSGRTLFQVRGATRALRSLVAHS